MPQLVKLAWTRWGIKNKGIFERSEKTDFVWVSKRYRVRRSSPKAASHDSWITKILNTSKLIRG
ncbi:MAG: hypothetical protein A2X18_08065 [Bacteroidetes bacterium GWF2_40_14]|nr:MAG: hypothetical protein A2X18_08065 [Bacteroidetes bacterium GWF2_40_14]